MKKKALVLKFKDSDREYLFKDKVFVIEDEKLVENLEKPSIKNGDSDLFIHSLNDTHISDVVQLKVNMSETGYFLVSFEHDSLNDEKRERLIEEIKKLRSNAAQTNSTQLKKSKQLISILNKYKPIYATFINNGEYTVNVTKLSLEELSFPLLVLKTKEKKFVIEPKPAKPRKDGKTRKYSSFPILSVDYIFVLLFSMLCAFGTLTAIFEFKNDENIWIFLGILAFAFAVVLILSVQSTCYKKGKLINPFMRYYLIIFVLIGVAGGIVAGYYVSQLVLKTKIENFDYKNLLILSSAISGPVCLSALSTSRLANLIIKKRYQ